MDSSARPTVFFAGGGTGGHLYPALAIAETLVSLDARVQPYFIGAERGIERQVLPQHAFPHTLLDLHPLYRPRVWNNWRTMRGAVSAWCALGALVRTHRPRLVVGTGGYASGLTLGYAVVHQIPLVEQIADSFPGMTARWFARHARECYLGYPEAAERLNARSREALIDTGNPIVPPPDPRPDRAIARAAWQFDASVSCVLLVVGGSQGARAINDVVSAWIGRGVPDGLGIIWATGRAQHDRYASLAQSRVRVCPYLSPIRDAYAATDVVIARAGAMTTAELCAWGFPMMLVPLPTAAADHQTANARALENAGAAVHVPQSSFTVDTLTTLVERAMHDAAWRAQVGARALARGRPHAAEEIAGRILRLL